MMRPLLVVGLLASLAACGDSGSTSTGAGGGGGGGTGGSTTSSNERECIATFRVLQKDAYSDVAGRSSDLWPPHTTTVLDVTCDGTPAGGSFHENHGTLPDAKDANGDVFLVEVGTYTATGPESAVQALATEYAACVCEPETKFLSLDTIDDATAQSLINTVSTYLNDNLTCDNGTTPDDVVGALQNGDVDVAIMLFGDCTWIGATSFEEGLDDALTTILEETAEALDGYHVCNNDAALQKSLFDDFKATGVAKTCDATASVCHGPMWLYEP